MINVIINGSAGKMGKIVASLIKEEKDMQVVAGIDPNIYDDPDFPIFPSIQECDVKADVIIDFSVSYVVPFLLDYSVKNNIPLVLCTTGLSEEVSKEALRKAIHKLPLKCKIVSRKEQEGGVTNEI